MNESKQLPHLDPQDIPEFLQGDGWFCKDTTGLYLDFTKPYKPPRWTLSHSGTPFAKLGDIHVIAGKSGHGKTALMSQFMACVLKGAFGNLRYELHDVSKPVVLYIDTEMSEDDTIAIKNRVCKLAGLDYTQPQEQFKVVRLRDTEQAHERWKQILKVIWEVKPTVAFLDGMLDIVNDYNDQTECQPIIRKCMKLVTHYDMSMWCVLHENPTAEKMVGTLGSILQRKVTEVFTVRKHKHEKDKYPQMPDIFFEVQQPKARGKDQDEWCFEMLSVEGWGVPMELDSNGRAEDPEDRREREFIKEANDRFCRLTWTSTGMSRADLDSGLIRQGVTSNRRRADLISIALDQGILYKSGERQRPKYHYNLNGKQPNDQAEDLPFARPDNTEPVF